MKLAKQAIFPVRTSLFLVEEKGGWWWEIRMELVHGPELLWFFKAGLFHQGGEIKGVMGLSPATFKPPFKAAFRATQRKRSCVLVRCCGRSWTSSATAELSSVFCANPQPFVLEKQSCLL